MSFTHGMYLEHLAETFAEDWRINRPIALHRLTQLAAEEAAFIGAYMGLILNQKELRGFLTALSKRSE